MNRVRPVLISFLLLVLVFGCGEEEQSPLEVVSETSRIPVPEGSAAAALEVPEDSGVKPEEMTIMVGDQEITPYATGEFAVPEPEIPQMMLALNPDGKVRYFGFVLPKEQQAAPARGKGTTQIPQWVYLGPESTAIELVFLSCMLQSVPPELYAEAIQLVKDESAVQSFVDVLDREMKGHPYSSLEEILPTVQSEFIAAVSAVNERIADDLGQPMAPALGISPTKRQSGCEITRDSQDPEGLINISNYYRRFVYVIAHEPGVMKEMEKTFVGMAPALVSPDTLIEFFRGGEAHFETEMQLSLTAQNDEFELDVMGPGLTGELEEKWLDEYYYKASLATVGMVYAIPFVKHVLGSSLESAFSIGFSPEKVVELFALETLNVSTGINDIKNAWDRRNIGLMAWETANYLWGSRTFQEMLVQQLGKTIAAGLVEKALPVLKVAGIIVEGINVGYATAQMVIADPQVTFSAVEAEAVIRITEPSSDSRTDKAVVLLAGEVENNTSDQVSISVNGFTKHTANITNGQFSAMVTLDDGENVIEALVDGARAQIKVFRVKHTPVVDTGEMVLIPAGECMMGDHHGNGSSDERPVHPVYLDAFYIDKYEATNAQYQKFVDATGHAAPNNWIDSRFNAPQQPVVGVSWHDAMAYAQWAGKRLPTEAEWEKAARGGLPGKRYPWGDGISHDDANYRGTGGKDVWSYTSPVGSFAPNGYELCDMAGNVGEWCADWYDQSYYADSPYNNPLGPDSGPYRVLRGGGWNYNTGSLRVSDRGGNGPADTFAHLGFRCVSQD